MVEITEKLNADRAIRVWALETALHPVFTIPSVVYPALHRIEIASMLERYVNEGFSKQEAVHAGAEFPE